MNSFSEGRPGVERQRAGDSAKEPYLSLVPAVDQSIRLLFALANIVGGEATLTELANSVGISKSKALAILNTLRNAGLVDRAKQTKNYRLGANCLVLARALVNHTDLAQAAAPYLEELAASTGASFHLGVVSGETLVVVARRHAPGGTYIPLDVGHRYPLTWGAHGRAFLATLPEEEFESRLAESHVLRAGETQRDAIDREVLRAEVEEARRLGYGLNLGTTWTGLNAVSTPVYVEGPDMPRGRYAAGFMVAVGSFDEEKAHEMGAEMREVAAEMGQRLGELFRGVNLHFPLSQPLWT